MTRIKELKKTLCEIQKAQYDELSRIMQKTMIPMPERGMDSIRDKCIKRVHTVIQTERMIRSCILAKWSCVCAAIAAIASCISVILVLFRG